MVNVRTVGFLIWFIVVVRRFGTVIARCVVVDCGGCTHWQVTGQTPRRGPSTQGWNSYTA